MMTGVPLLVPCPEASRHMLPYTCSCLLEVLVHAWLAWPLQSHSWTRVPPVWLELGTSTHRPDWAPRIRLPCPPPPPPPPPPPEESRVMLELPLLWYPSVARIW